MTTDLSVTVAVEGESDRGMAEAVIAHAGLTLRRCVVKNGVGNLDKLIGRLAATTLNEPWIVFRDSDRECPVELLGRLVGRRPPGRHFALRLVSPMTEAWLMADAAGFAEHFGVRPSKIPDAPEDLPHPKTALLSVCQSARRRAVRADMVRPGPELQPGPLYVHGLNTFAREAWDPGRARERSPSLDRTLRRLRAMAEAAGS